MLFMVLALGTWNLRPDPSALVTFCVPWWWRVEERGRGHGAVPEAEQGGRGAGGEACGGCLRGASGHGHHMHTSHQVRTGH